MNKTTHSIPIAAGDDSQTGNARRQAMTLASALDFSELRCGQLGIIVTEAARNVSLHGGGGEILLTSWQNDGASGLDVLALDGGSGMQDVGAALQDGYSTGGTAGTGLGAIQRMAHTFQVDSRPGRGTVIFARILRSETDPIVQNVVSEGSINLPLAGETLCGDAWSCHREKDRSVYIMADGLGHGPVAHDAATEAMQSFGANFGKSPTRILQDVHAALQKTRGAAVAVAEVLHDRRVVNYVGSGNIASFLHSGGKTRSLVSMNGTPGHSMGRLQEFTYPWTPEALLIMHTDGLNTRWDLGQYVGLAARHPSLIAGVLYRDFSRKRDDATILVTGLHA